MEGLSCQFLSRAGHPRAQSTSGSHQLPRGDPQVQSVLSRTLGAAPGPHSPECQPPLSLGPWEESPVGEALKSGLQPVSRTYLKSLKNKLPSGAWRKSCQPGDSAGPETQVRSQSQDGWL